MTTLPNPEPMPSWQVPVEPAGSREKITASGIVLGSIALIAFLVALSVRSQLVFGILTLAVIFIPLERIFGLHPQKLFRRGWRTDMVHLAVNGILLTVLLAGAVSTIGLLMHLAIPGPIHNAISAQPAFLQIIEAFAVAEIGGYIGHRAAHEIPLLWRFHRVHHSIKEMDWLAANHLHPLDQAFIRSCSLVPIYGIGLSKAGIGAFVVVLTFHAIFIHANVRLTFGPLRWVVGTPEFHHWHHANVKEAYNSNYAALFPVIDWIFGTLHLPAGRRTAQYGVDAVEPRGYLRQLVWPFERSG